MTFPGAWYTNRKWKTRMVASVCTVPCWVLKDIYPVSACERSSELISSGLLINILCFMEYLINAHTLMLLPSPCLSWILLGRWPYDGRLLGLQVHDPAQAEDGPLTVTDRHHTWSQSTRSGTQQQHSTSGWLLFSLICRREASCTYAAPLVIVFGSSINQKAHRRRLTCPSD